MWKPSQRFGRAALAGTSSSVWSSVVTSELQHPDRDAERHPDQQPGDQVALHRSTVGVREVARRRRTRAGRGRGAAARGAALRTCRRLGSSGSFGFASAAFALASAAASAVARSCRAARASSPPACCRALEVGGIPAAALQLEARGGHELDQRVLAAGGTGERAARPQNFCSDSSSCPQASSGIRRSACADPRALRA